ncbi:hypothetical protein HDF19_10240 [Mucilaginibacter sp. E4BP6]|uniref:hypothetical protein n=1 Tax=Mucilaginibacter sp. E4BP6 TaxID=2723089 RepID=UPI0015CBBF05|nr:hypothetical protein [Mucilaginibacter sp. E4BP6]NYE65473.1 hypothetical protein [Mucilaginibacter sp. E4BP6]
MILTKYLKHITFIALISVLTQSKSYAGGFPIRPGKLILSPSVSYFFASKQWDSTGVKKPFANDGKFTSISISLYAEYGISRRFSAVALVPYVINEFKQTGYDQKYSGLTDAETGIKYYLANINYIYYFSLQGTAITPMYRNPINGGPLLGYGEEGAELKLSFAGSGNLFNRSYYFNVDNAVRQYFGNDGPIQYRYNATFGITLDRKFKEQISASFGGFYSVSNFKQFNDLNPTLTRDFRFNQVSVSYGHAFSHDLSLFLTGGQFITGRNTGDGTSASLAFVYRIGN